MKRRRVNKTAVHRELGLLQRALATFVGDFNVRLAALKTMTYYDEATAKELKKGGCGGDEAKARIQRGCEDAKEATKAGCLRGGEDGAFGWLVV